MIKIIVQIFFGIIAVIASCIGLFGFYFPTIISANDDATVIGGMFFGSVLFLGLFVLFIKFIKFIIKKLSE